MRFPKLQPPAPKTLKVPDLAGGLNLRDGVSEVLDNQLTQAKNVWWQDGVLKTRPGISGLSEIFVGRATEQKVSQKMWPKVKYKANGKEYVLTVIKKDENVGYSGQYRTALKFYWQSNKGTIDITWLTFDEEVSYFVTQDDSAIYVFTSNCEIYKLEYSLLNDVNDFVKLEEKDMYVPTIAINCYSGPHAVGGEAPEMLLAGATMINGFNLIGNRAKFFYSTVNLDLLTDESPNQYMHYDIPYLGENRTLIPQLLEVTVTHLNGSVVTHTATQYDGQLEYESLFYESACQEDGLKIKVFCNGSNGQIVFYDENDDTAQLTKSDYILNNLEIIIPFVSSSEDRAKVFGATQCEWFGGGTEGIAGGTRLFLGGNTEEANKNLVVWSDLNNPLYFPENNYFRVGENSSAVTGFGKQADMLVIFKENGSGIYYTKYQQNGDITAEDLINQNVVDYVASSVYFPLVQVNPNVGCSYPETIQLCRNRLVWLGDNGDVYTLINESQYNERSVFCVSEMVRRDLRRSISGMPTACDWNGYYCLRCGNKLYLMDYNCYGYTHIAGYSKTEDANIRIPWYIWELPFEASMCESDGDILFTRYNDGESYAECVALSYALSPDNRTVDNVYVFDSENGEFALEKRPIQTVLRTKLFDFGEASTRKSVDKINLQLGNNGGERITVKVITDQSEEEHDIYLNGTQTEAYTPGYIDSKAIFPCARNVLRV
ncbi:MAG: hypothetical protein J6B80_04930, partial [Clostridia bacterium]|nr:hypothetical protein [Clostridia bacterium]